MVRTQDLWEYKEFDRSLAPKSGNKHDHLEQVRRFILKNGFQERTIITCDLQSGKAYVTEGNHRLWVAIKEGIKFVPCRVSLIETFDSTTRQAMCIYSDPAYPLRVHLQAPFSIDPTNAYNHPMSAVHSSVEWLFDDWYVSENGSALDFPSDEEYSREEDSDDEGADDATH
ncbi:hypothetical protein ACROYT_G015529 [Oculina patagonica]